MTQILCGISPEGIMVATDSMATSFEADGQERSFPIDKLFAVGSHAFIVSGGIGISVELSRRFKLYAEERRLLGIEAITGAAGAYLSDQYGDALRGSDRQLVGREQLDRIYFVVGGYSFRSEDRPYQLAFWGSEAGQLPLQRIQVGNSLAVPRTISGETKLFRMCQEKSPLTELIDFAQRFLQRLSEKNSQVGPPFRFGTVTSEGFRRFEQSFYIG